MGLLAGVLVTALGIYLATNTAAPPSFTTGSAASAGQSFTENLNGVELKMVGVPGGEFLMGLPESEEGRDSDEGPQHRVTVQAFSIGKYEITQAQWKAVMGGNNPSHFKGDDLPVDSVTWNDAKEFCQKLARMTGKSYRLPSEAEWEYACRAGTTGAYAGNLDAMAWYGDNSDRTTHPVGQKRANAFGLFDMHGNVWEWCEDIWHYNYNGAPTDGSAWLSGGDSSLRVLRGGSCDDYSWFVRSSYRLPLSYRDSNGRYADDVRGNIIGFRVVVASRTQ